jgi:hypothetical protein
MDLIKELKENKTILLLVSPTKYNDSVVAITKKLSKQSLCYVTLNKTYQSLDETFNKKKINCENIVYVDGISKTIKKTPQQVKNSYFVSNPGSLTELSLVISKFLKHNFSYLVFDSLNSLIVYEKKAPVSKFVSSLVNKIRTSKTKAVFLALEGYEDKIIKETSMFVDKVIKV